jgi:HAD superfamily hydrolase (TIGR01490 family)
MGAERDTDRGTREPSSTGLDDIGRIGSAQLEAELAVPPDPTAAAFFDVDNTLMRGASIFYFARGLYRREFFTVADLLGFAWHQVRFTTLGENLDHVEAIRERALSFVAGHTVSELTAIGEEVYDEVMAEKIWPGTHALAQMHLDAGQRVWLVTATPIEMADVIARRLGVSGADGTLGEQGDGVFRWRVVCLLLHGPA